MLHGFDILCADILDSCLLQFTSVRLKQNHLKVSKKYPFYGDGGGRGDDDDDDHDDHDDDHDDETFNIVICIY